MKGYKIVSNEKGTKAYLLEVEVPSGTHVIVAGGKCRASCLKPIRAWEIAHRKKVSRLHLLSTSYTDTVGPYWDKKPRTWKIVRATRRTKFYSVRAFWSTYITPRVQEERMFCYTLGELVKPDKFDLTPWHGCSSGLHFFIDKNSALKYL